jgi:histidinol-phosphate aminotransferase
VTGFSSTYDPGVETGPDDVLALHRNENLFVGREWTVDAARELVERAAISSYPDAASLPLREALAELHGVSAGMIFVGNGADEVLSDLLGVLRRDHDTLHLLDVRFGVYDLLAERLGFATAVLPGDTFATGHIDAQGFGGLAVVDSPNAITASSIARDELAALASAPGSFLIWDNVYGEYAGDSVPAPLPDNVAFVRSFSKFYGLAGLRVGYCIAREDLIADMLARKDVFNVNSFAQVMAREALARHADFVAARDALVEARTELVAMLTGLGFVTKPSDAVAVLASHPEHPGKPLQNALLEQGIAVRRFHGPLTADWIRITVAPQTQRDRLLRALGQVLGEG